MQEIAMYILFYYSASLHFPRSYLAFSAPSTLELLVLVVDFIIAN